MIEIRFLVREIFSFILLIFRSCKDSATSSSISISLFLDHDETIFLAFVRTVSLIAASTASSKQHSPLRY